MDVWVGSSTVSLSPVMPAALSAAERIDTLEGLARVRAWADAQEQHLLAAMAGPGDPPRTFRDPVAVDKQFVRGVFGLPCARCLVEAVGLLPDKQARLVELPVLANAGRQTLRGFRDSVARMSEHGMGGRPAGRRRAPRGSRRAGAQR